MTNLHINDIVSIKIDKNWVVTKVIGIKDMPISDDTQIPMLFIQIDNIMYGNEISAEGDTWMRGIHPSLIPADHMLCPIEPTDAMLTQKLNTHAYLFTDSTSEDDRNLIYRAMTKAYAIPQHQYNTYGFTWGEGNAWNIINKDSSHD